MSNRNATTSQAIALLNLGGLGRIHERHMADDGKLIVLIEPKDGLYRSVALDRLGRWVSIMNVPLDEDGNILSGWHVHPDPVPGKIAVQDKDGQISYETQDKRRVALRG